MRSPLRLGQQMFRHPFSDRDSFREFCRLQAQKSDSSTKEFALVGARIYPAPGAKPIVNGVIVVAGGKIVSVGEAIKCRRRQRPCRSIWRSGLELTRTQR